MARVAQGIGSAGLHLMPQTIVGAVTPPRERPRVLSIIGAAFPVAILVGPLLGGLDHRLRGDGGGCSGSTSPSALIALALAVVAVPHIDRTQRQRSSTSPGPSRSGSPSPALVLAASWASSGRAGAAPRRRDRRRSSRCCRLAAFIAIELRVPEPLVPLRHFANRTILVTHRPLDGDRRRACSRSSRTCRPTSRWRTAPSATVSGLVPIATVFGMLVSTLRHRMAREPIRVAIASFPIFGTALAAVGLLDHGAAAARACRSGCRWLAMALVGVGTGAFMNIIVAVAQSAAPRSDTGSVTATVSLVRQIGSTTATAIVGGVIGVGVAAGLPASLDAATLTPQAVHGVVGRRAGPGRRALHERAGARSSSGSRSRTRSASSRRCCCRTAGCPTISNPCPRRAARRPPPRDRTRRGDAMSHHPTIAIVGSGPIGSAYARVLARAASRRARRHVRGRPAAHRAFPARACATSPTPTRRSAPASCRRARRPARSASRSASRGTSWSRACSPPARARTCSTSAARARATRRPFPAAAASTNVGGHGRALDLRDAVARVQREDPLHRRRRVGRPARGREGSAARAGRGLRRLRGRRGHPLAAGGGVRRRAARGLRPEHASGRRRPAAGRHDALGGSRCRARPARRSGFAAERAVRAARPVARPPRRGARTAAPPVSRSRTCAPARRGSCPPTWWSSRRTRSALRSCCGPPASARRSRPLPHRASRRHLDRRASTPTGSAASRPRRISMPRSRVAR